MARDATIRDPALDDASALKPGAVFGLYPASEFRLANGHCNDCPTIPQALWYFQGEVIAAAKPGRPVASFRAGLSVADDLKAWVQQRDPDAALEFPPLVWVAAPDVVSSAHLAGNASMLDTPAGALRASLVPKIALNRSYFDATSAAFFHRRTLKVRGRIDNGAVAMRTLWPEDFRIDCAPPTVPLPADKPAALALRERMRAEPCGGAESPFAVSMLWQRDAKRDSVPPRRAVLGIMVNGAQGDDDEAHGGHFALVTGRTDASGAIGDWLVNNFYALDSESEKGILAAPVPLDNYLADLNSGQAWYRPSQMLVLVLAGERAAALVQAALNRVYNQFYRHQLPYRHASMNCAGISVDVLRALGWDIPARGPASRAAAVFAFPYVAAKERSVAKARVAFDYLVEDQTRLMPAAAFEECGAAALRLAVSGRHDVATGALARMLADDLEAIAFVHIPQLPSSRVFGDAPVVTPWEFRTRMPPEPQIIPVPPRPLPAALRAQDLVPVERPASDYAAIVWGIVLIVGIPMFVFRHLKAWWNKPGRT
jgi:hypothetical protein